MHLPAVGRLGVMFRNLKSWENEPPRSKLRGINCKLPSPLPNPPHQGEGILQGSCSRLRGIDQNYDDKTKRDPSDAFGMAPHNINRKLWQKRF